MYKTTLKVHEDAPPFLLIHGTLDSLASINDGRVFSQKLRAVSRQPVVFAELPGTEHAFETMHSPRTEATIDAVHRFLEWSLANAPGPSTSAAQQTEETTEKEHAEATA